MEIAHFLLVAWAIGFYDVSGTEKTQNETMKVKRQAEGDEGEVELESGANEGAVWTTRPPRKKKTDEFHYEVNPVLVPGDNAPIKMSRREMTNFIQDTAAIVTQYSPKRLVEFVQAMKAEVKNYYYPKSSFDNVFIGIEQHRVNFERMFDNIGTDIDTVNKTLANYTELFACSKRATVARAAKILDDTYEDNVPVYAEMTHYLSAYGLPYGNLQTLAYQTRKFMRLAIFDHLSKLDGDSRKKFAEAIGELQVPPIPPVDRSAWHSARSEDRRQQAPDTEEADDDES